MAIVAKRETEEKYSHLKKLYTGDKKDKVITKSDDSDNNEVIEFKKDELEIDNKEYLKVFGILAAIGIIGAAGYLLERFL